MRILLFGANGWIGQQFSAQTRHTIIIATTRPENYEDALNEIRTTSPDSVVSMIGRTHGTLDDGTHVPTIDYLEHPGKLYENMRDNYIAPINLAKICDTLHIHYVYLGTGCIYTYTDDKRIFAEDDAPNFFGSSYSIVKGFTNTSIQEYSTTLQLRIRMPISKNASPRNLIDKLISYKNICSIPNSMTVLDDMWPIIDRMIENKTTGTYNMCNPGTAEHKWILSQYKRLIEPAHTWTDVSYDEQMKHIRSHRSNNEMTTTKLEQFCKENDITLPHIQDSITRCIFARCIRPSQ